MSTEVYSTPFHFDKSLLELTGLQDLEFCCKDGQVVQTSSFPLALYSPVIRVQVGERNVKEFGMKEFSQTSVLQLVESCYTGFLTVTRETFREINKLSLIFKIDWMTKQCLDFYTELCSKLASNSGELAEFLFEEATPLTWQSRLQSRYIRLV